MNTWHWESEEGFNKHVRPIELAARTTARVSKGEVASRNVEGLSQAVHDYAQAFQAFRSAFHQAVDGIYSDADFDELQTHALLLVHAAERIFAYCKPLALIKAGQNFISYKDQSEHLPRFYKEGGKKCEARAEWLLNAAEPLLEAIHDFFGGDEQFLTFVADLPDDLKADFVSARDVMSLGFEEAGLIYAGRGLEGVVRRIARDHTVGKQPVERERFVDILRAFESKRFSHNLSIVIDEPTKHLLAYSRAARNQSAHPIPDRKPQPYREQAILMAQKANELWKQCAASGVKFV